MNKLKRPKRSASLAKVKKTSDNTTSNNIIAKAKKSDISAAPYTVLSPPLMSAVPILRCTLCPHRSDSQLLLSMHYSKEHADTETEAGSVSGETEDSEQSIKSLSSEDKLHRKEKPYILKTSKSGKQGRKYLDEGQNENDVESQEVILEKSNKRPSDDGAEVN